MPREIKAPQNNALFYARILIMLALIGICTQSDESKATSSVKSSEPDESYLVPPEGIELEGKYLVCEELPATEPEVPLQEKPFDELVAEVDRVLKAGVPHQLQEKIDRIRPKNICYVGDSYMVGITHDRDGKVNRSNVQAKVGRPFISNRKEWEGDDIRKHAIDALNNPDCRLLVLNGGLNDLYTDCDVTDEAEARVRKGYEEVFGLAWEKEIDVVLFDIPKPPVRTKFKAEINVATDRLNAFLAESGVIHLIDTDKVVERFARDKMHPAPRGYRKLFQEIRKRIR
ncbi:SGNH/GDSL hydrolase family protein [Patescibacteria group bacterium]|nr:SGNH/GDSL hydrolase family protein [Patescibacteria group bacterium]